MLPKHNICIEGSLREEVKPMLELTITAKVQVKVSAADKALLLRTMDAYRQACNHVAEHIFTTHDLKLASLNKALYRDLRAKFGLKSQMAQSVLKTVMSSYKTILTNQKEWIQPSFKIPQIDLVWNRDYSLRQDAFSVNTLSGRVKLGYYAQGMEEYFNKDIYRFGTASWFGSTGNSICTFLSPLKLQSVWMGPSSM